MVVVRGDGTDLRGGGAAAAAGHPGGRPVARLAAALRGDHRAAGLAVGLGLLGVGYRLALLLAEIPPSNSDEATSGLVALHIAQGREFPLFFYGQYYMGALESYLAAPLFALAGPSTLALRLPNLLLYAVFLALMWRLTRRLYGPWLAAATVGLLALGSDRILKNQLIAGGGYPEMNPAGALLVLLAVTLGLGAVPRAGRSGSGAVSSRAPLRFARWRPRRGLAYAGWGLVAGLTLWDDWLVLPYVGAAGVLLLAANWRELRGRAGPPAGGAEGDPRSRDAVSRSSRVPVLALAGGLAVGLVPIVAHNLTAAPAQRSLAVYASLGGGEAASWADRWYGGVLFGVPMGTGFCDPSRCQAWQLWWGVAYPILLVAAGVLAARALRQAARTARAVRAVRAVRSDSDVRSDSAARSAPAPPSAPASPSDAAGPAEPAARAELVRQGGRLALVVAAALSLLGYATSSAAGTTPVESARYLSCLLISTPAVLWPLWSALRHTRRPLPRVAAALPLGALAVTTGVATVAVLTAAPELARPAQQRRELVAALDRMGVDRFYGEYWTCNPITFLTRERLVCAVIRDDLRAGWDRYPPHRDLVAAAPDPAYVLPAGSPLSAAVAAHLAATGVPADVTTVAGYDVYRTPTRPALPLR